MIENKVWTGDCQELFGMFDDKTVDLVFADPPFNIGYEYDTYKDNLSEAEYCLFTNDWVSECVRLLADHGSMYVAIGDENAVTVKLAMDRFNMHMRNWIVWHYTFGTHHNTKFGRSKTHILYYTKSKKNFTFNCNDIRIESERRRIGDPRANPHGRVPCDVWTFPRICGNHKERTAHPAQMPEAVMERAIRASSDVGDLVFDPFVGSGSTLAVAKKLGRRYFGFELSDAYANIARDRLDNITEGK